MQQRHYPPSDPTETHPLLAPVIIFVVYILKPLNYYFYKHFLKDQL